MKAVAVSEEEMEHSKPIGVIAKIVMEDWFNSVRNNGKHRTSYVSAMGIKSRKVDCPVTAEVWTLLICFEKGIELWKQ